MQSATRRIGMPTSTSDGNAELHAEVVAGDPDGTTMDDMHVKDMGRPTDGNIPEDQAATGSGPTSPVKKKVTSFTTAKTNGMSPNPTVKKVL